MCPKGTKPRLRNIELVGQYADAQEDQIPAHPMSHRHLTNLKPHRKRSGFTQEELGFLLGHKKHSAISRYEAGERSPDLKTAFAYQVLFGRALEELFPGLQDEVRSEVGKRAQQLAQEISEHGESRKAPYKLERLGRLAKEVFENAPTV